MKEGENTEQNILNQTAVQAKDGLPQSVLESLARELLPKLQQFYGSESGQIQLRQWRMESGQ